MNKATYLFAFFLVSPFLLFAQIPNPGFENWTSFTGYDVPDQWGNLNPSTSSVGVYTVLKGTTAPASGSAYVKLTTKDVGGVIKPGIVVSGQLDPVTLKPVSGFAYSSQPKNLKGKWQYMGYGNDAATISAWLTRWNTVSGKRDTIASLTAKPSGMLHSWGTFTFPFVYTNSANPDTAVIMISSSGQVPEKNSFIWIDDLSFDGTVTSINTPEQSTNLVLYPNPASSFVKMTYTSPKNEEVSVRLLDNIGNVVYSSLELFSSGTNQNVLDLDSEKIRSGIYFFQIRTSSGIVTRKLVVKK